MNSVLDSKAFEDKIYFPLERRSLHKSGRSLLVPLNLSDGNCARPESTMLLPLGSEFLFEFLILIDICSLDLRFCRRFPLQIFIPSLSWVRLLDFLYRMC